MKQITNISLGPASDNYQMEAEFLGQKFNIKRFGTDGDLKKAEDMLLMWNKKADVICLSAIKYLYGHSAQTIMTSKLKKLLKVANTLTTPVTTGETLRRVTHEWCIRHAQFQLGNNFFTNAKVLFLSGMASEKIANVMSEYTGNISFADPIFENSIPKILHSQLDLNRYAQRIHRPISWLPGKDLISEPSRIKAVNNYILQRAARDATVIVIPYNDFYDYIEPFSEEELKDKVIVTTTAYEDRIDALREKGVSMIIDTTPKILDRVVGVSVQEALMISALDIPKTSAIKDDLLEVISEQRLDPRIVYPQSKPKRINRFAYVIHPLSREDLKKLKPLELITEIMPKTIGPVEKLMAYAPPIVYTKITGIESPEGVEAEGWLIGLGETPEQMEKHSPEFTTKRILQAAEKARSLGAQVMGISMLPHSLEGTSIDIGKYAVLPVTTGNSYTASTALWASAEAVRQMGIVKLKNNKTLRGKTMVIGATGAVGSICARLLAKAFEEVYLVSRNMAKLLTIQETVQAENPDVTIHVSTRADTHIADMDVVVAATKGADKTLDIMRVKPGCVITDITRPMIFTSEDAAKRQDVLIITGGEILLPGNKIDMKDIGLPPRAVYAGLAETIILALEGRFEEFTTGSNTEWQKVKEIYKLGLKHGMKLSAISGVNGVLGKDDITRVKEFALKKIKKHETDR
ncbi:Shikimate/quinate 5-dehydrogenase [Desulfamplus magnetovallimortis]|uniref:Shikimate/quinate 5-dehydrogenase n=1 Tax=Desulfamplus magnetovallimortis TaxID=1246637 RepID=A0A1W1HCJ9_9BACT|nr:dehydrogenase [Desulfamplus magnetovallimortis]SLM30200.1 Shikimate/quinate 5-dehydrogenase [Desulfamplus magnetovallimortis]